MIPYNDSLHEMRGLPFALECNSYNKNQPLLVLTIGGVYSSLGVANGGIDERTNFT